MRLLRACWKKKLQFRNSGLAPQNRSMKKTDYRTHVTPGRLPCLHIAALARVAGNSSRPAGLSLGMLPFLAKVAEFIVMQWLGMGVVRASSFPRRQLIASAAHCRAEPE